jgi:hypothetical protein
MSAVHVSETGALESLVARVVDEFLERQKRGDKPDPAEYAARHPEAAGVLREVLAALHVVGLSSAAGLAGNTGDGPVTGILGDFRVLREIGRGGMGVVYEAEQISLGRRVALKVLPFAAAMDARQLQRFKNEAQAAAQLQHTNIVPVYAVGCERGVHYYAMQYIEGHTLAAVIREGRGRKGVARAAWSLERVRRGGARVRFRAAPRMPSPIPTPRPVIPCLNHPSPLTPRPSSLAPRRSAPLHR